MNRLLMVAALLVAAWPATATGQTPPGPFGGLFGRTPEKAGGEFTAIEFRTSGGGQYDDGLFLDEQVDAAERTQGGYTTGMNVALAAARKTTKSMLNATGTAGYMEYLAPRPFGATSFDGMFSGSRTVTQRLDLKAAAYYSHSPFFQALPASLSQSPEWMVPVVSNRFAARLLENDSAQGQVGITHHFAKHSAISAYASGKQVWFRQEPESNFDMVGGQVGWTHQLKRDLGVHVAYGRENYHTRQVDAPLYSHEYLDIGLDFARDISIARRTTLGIATQTAMLREADGPRKYRLNGTATLTKWFQKTWHASLGAQRATDFIPGLFKPLFSDTANASIGGMVGKRADWFAMAGGGVGRFGFDPSAAKFRTATATTRLNVGFSRRIGAYVQYSLYHYELPPATEGIALLDQLSRQSAIVGLNVWVPIFQEVKTPRGPQ